MAYLRFFKYLNISKYLIELSCCTVLKCAFIIISNDLSFVLNCIYNYRYFKTITNLYKVNYKKKNIYTIYFSGDNAPW